MSKVKECKRFTQTGTKASYVINRKRYCKGENLKMGK